VPRHPQTVIILCTQVEVKRPSFKHLSASNALVEKGSDAINSGVLSSAVVDVFIAVLGKQKFAQSLHGI